MRMYTTTNTRLRHSTDPIIKNSSLSPGQSLRYLDFPTRPNRQAPGHANQGESSKHAQHFLFFFQELRPALLDVGDTSPVAGWRHRGAEGVVSACKQNLKRKKKKRKSDLPSRSMLARCRRVTVPWRGLVLGGRACRSNPRLKKRTNKKTKDVPYCCW